MGHNIAPIGEPGPLGSDQLTDRGVEKILHKPDDIIRQGDPELIRTGTEYLGYG